MPKVPTIKEQEARALNVATENVIEAMQEYAQEGSKDTEAEKALVKAVNQFKDLTKHTLNTVIPEGVSNEELLEITESLHGKLSTISDVLNSAAWKEELAKHTSSSENLNTLSKVAKAASNEVLDMHVPMVVGEYDKPHISTIKEMNSQFEKRAPQKPTNPTIDWAKVAGLESDRKDGLEAEIEKSKGKGSAQKSDSQTVDPNEAAAKAEKTSTHPLKPVNPDELHKNTRDSSGKSR